MGNNELEEVPTCIGHMIQLERLHLYHNNISSINPLCIGNNCCVHVSVCISINPLCIGNDWCVCVSVCIY